MTTNLHTEGLSGQLQDVQDIVSTLTRQLTGLRNSPARQSPNNGKELISEDDHGMSIVTLAGENKGATMKGDLEGMMDFHGELYDDDDETGMSAYTNSNYQAANNSIVFGGNCEAKEPGVHIVISDCFDDDSDDEMHAKTFKDKKNEESLKERIRKGHSE